MLKGELKTVQDERDLLVLRLINTPTRVKGLSTRSQINHDKLSYKFDSLGATDSKVIVRDVCERLGVVDHDALMPALDKILLVFSLIPQMETVLNR